MLTIAGGIILAVVILTVAPWLLFGLVAVISEGYKSSHQPPATPQSTWPPLTRAEKICMPLVGMGLLALVGIAFWMSNH